MPTSNTSGGAPGPERDGQAGTRRVLPYVAIALVVALFTVGWAALVRNYGGNPAVRAQMLTFEVHSEPAVTVRFKVRKPAEAVAMCQVRALDSYHRTVGRVSVRVPAGKTLTTVTHRVTASTRPTSAEIIRCRVISGG